MANTKTGKPAKARRTLPPMTVRVVRVEPSDAARNAMDRAWARLLEEQGKRMSAAARAEEEPV